MNRWLEKFQFLWREEPPSPEADGLTGERPRARSHEPSGVPAWLRRATHLTLSGLVGVTLMAQIIGVRLVAPVDASGTYGADCQNKCKSDWDRCTKACNNNSSCVTNCRLTYNACSKKCGTGLICAP